MLYGSFVEGQKRELVIPRVDPLLMKALLRFINTGRVTLQIDKIVPMIKLIDYYCVRGAHEEFEKAAMHFIDSSTKTNE